MNYKNLIRRIITYTVGLFILAIGVVFTINADLGVSPVQSLPYVLSNATDQISIGLFTTILMAVFILLQVAILRRQFKLYNLTQLLFSFIFGFFVDFAVIIVGDFVLPTYFGQMAMLLVGIGLISVGVVLFIGAKLVPLPTEGFCLAVTQIIKTGIFSKFHIVKITMDSGLVIIALACSFLLLDGLHGIREGTVIAAAGIGITIPSIRKLLSPILRGIK
ncbi:MAG: DUF6198 family protein [Defluviitaleaceae bacterium]|nr:DUF6198 family protein [Defluviitaleaceae bacterium]